MAEGVRRGDRVQTKDRKIQATVLGFHEYGYLVKRDDGSVWIYLRNNVEVLKKRV